MKLSRSRVTNARSARLSIVLDDGSKRVFEIDGPILGEVEVTEDEIGVTSFGFPGPVFLPGRKQVEVNLTGTLLPASRRGSR